MRSDLVSIYLPVCVANPDERAPSAEQLKTSIMRSAEHPMLLADHIGDHVLVAFMCSHRATIHVRT